MGGAHAKTSAAPLERSRRAVPAYQHRFDAVLIIDAMENVSPEEWPVVVANLHRAGQAVIDVGLPHGVFLKRPDALHRPTLVRTKAAVGA